MCLFSFQPVIARDVPVSPPYSSSAVKYGSRVDALTMKRGRREVNGLPSCQCLPCSGIINLLQTGGDLPIRCTADLLSCLSSLLPRTRQRINWFWAQIHGQEGSCLCGCVCWRDDDRERAGRGIFLILYLWEQGEFFECLLRGRQFKLRFCFFLHNYWKRFRIKTRTSCFKLTGYWTVRVIIGLVS